MAEWSEESIRRINDAVRWVETQRGTSRHGPSSRRNSPTMPALVRGELDQTLAADEAGTLTTATGLQLQCTNASGATVTDGTAVWAFWSWDHSSYMILPAGEGGEAPHIYGELDEELEAGQSATMSVHDAHGDTGINVELADNLMPEGSSFPAGTFVWGAWHEGDGTWYLQSAKSCPAGGPESGGVTDHGQLTGNNRDDHVHYSLRNGSRWTTTQTPERVAISDTSGHLVCSTITTAELAALDGIEGNIETRIKALEDAGGGSPGGFDPNCVIVSDGSGDLVASSITTTELGHLDGVSSNIQTQLDGKSNTGHGHDIEDIDGLEDALAGKSNTGHGHAISDVTGLQTALDGKASATHSHAISDVTGLQTALDGKADASHGHDIEDIDGLEDALAGKSNTGHGHDISDITGLQTALDGKASATHSHAIADVTGLADALDGKAASSHGHAIADVTGLQTSLDAIDDALAAALTLPSICDGRLTLTSGVPITTSDVTGAGTLYWTPYQGNRVALYDGSQWQLHTFTELSLALSITSGTLYDVFVYDNSGSLTLELTAWTNGTTRATALATQDGVLVKSGDATRRYLGTLLASGTNITDDSAARRLLYNHYHRCARKLKKVDTTTSWTTSNDAWEPANASTANRVEVVIGVAGPAVRLTHETTANSPGANSNPAVGIGVDSTSANSADLTQYAAAQPHTHQISAQLAHHPAAGYHYYQALQRAFNANTAVFWGQAFAGITQGGLAGEVEL